MVEGWSAAGRIAKRSRLCYDGAMTEELRTRPGPLPLAEREQSIHHPEPRSRRGKAPLSRAWEAASLFLITLLAIVLRFYRLTEVPPGLHFDEAFKGVMARGMLEGGPLQLFFASNQGEEPLATYLVAAVIGLVGQDAWAIRLPSAVVGSLTVPLAWWLGRGLYRLARNSDLARAHIAENLQTFETQPAQDEGSLGEQIVGLGAAVVLGILYWHLTFSRMGMEPILVPFFATLTFAALVHGLNSGYSGKPRLMPFVLAGLALGGSFYTYKAGYFVPIVVALFVVYAIIVERGFLRRHGRGLLLIALVTILASLPLGVYFATHPADFLHRPTSVSLVGSSGLEGSWRALLDNLPRVLGMFFLEGDADPRRNLPGRPALDPFLACLFLVGLVRALAGFRRPALALAPIWLGVMIVPTLVTEYAPQFARAIGATPAMAVLCSLGGWTLWKGASKLGRRWVDGAVVALLLMGLVYSGFSTAWAYFHTWRMSPDLFHAYDVGLVKIAEHVNARPADEEVYITPLRPDHYTLEFLARRPYATFDGRDGLVLPPPGRAATVIVLPNEDGQTVPELQRFRTDATVSQTWNDDDGRPYAVALYLPASESGTPFPARSSDAVLGDAVRLLGYSWDADRATPSATIHLTLYWQALAPLDEDYTVFVHLLGEYNPATEGPLWAGHDSQPDGGHYPTRAWKPGEIILDVHALTIPADAPTGDYQVEAGLYLLTTMTRLPASDAAGNLLPGDSVVLGVIEVGE
jgi:4-amino-4-deoxy-L-arabinose transferase-like glycosyltransferase